MFEYASDDAGSHNCLVVGFVVLLTAWIVNSILSVLSHLTLLKRLGQDDSEPLWLEGLGSYSDEFQSIMRR